MTQVLTGSFARIGATFRRQLLRCGKVELVSSVNILLPADLVLAAKLADADVSHEAAKLIVLELLREDKISMGRAAELCQTPLEAFMEFASELGVALHYGPGELEEVAAPPNASSYIPEFIFLRKSITRS